jgi:hypothetical protein
MEIGLSLTCPSCGRRFASALQMDRETFERIKLEGQRDRCPFCGTSSWFEKGDYMFTTGDEPDSGT